MGKLRCEQHGLHIGILACRHLLDAVEKTGAPLEFKKVVQDWLGEDDTLIRTLLCLECIRAFGLDPEKVFPVIEDEDLDKKFPYVAPMCPYALPNFKKRTPPRLQRCRFSTMEIITYLERKFSNLR